MSELKKVMLKECCSAFQLGTVTMPCYFSEGELDEEIRVSMKSGNATQHEVDAVFCHFSKKHL